jgi:uncharacterized protein (TIGR00251 family)
LISQAAAGVEIDVKVIPRAKRSALGGVRDGFLVVRVAAPPVDNAANDALIAFLAYILRIPRRNVRISSGERSRRKRVVIEGAALDEVRTALQL